MIRLATDCDRGPDGALSAQNEKVNTRELEQLAALQRIDMYWEAHPGSPSATRRPRLLKRGRTWIALLGPNVRDGIVGRGPTIETALHFGQGEVTAVLDLQKIDVLFGDRTRRLIHAQE